MGRYRDLHPRAGAMKLLPAEASPLTLEQIIRTEPPGSPAREAAKALRLGMAYGAVGRLGCGMLLASWQARQAADAFRGVDWEAVERRILAASEPGA